jgi:hypothetical protein
VRIKLFATIMVILIFFSLFITLLPVKTGKFFSPIVEMATPDYIPGVMTINVSEDTWIGNGLLPAGCQLSPCSNGEEYCEKNCNFSHGGCENVGGTYIWVGKGSGTGSSAMCGVWDAEKHAYLWFNMSEGRTTNGNVIDIPWYLIKNATIKIWVDTVTNCQNISLRPVLPNENKNTINGTIHNLVYNNHYYSSGDYYTENSTFFGSEIKIMCPTVNTTSEWNITDYVINQTRYGNDVFVQLSPLGSFIPGGWSVSFSAKEHTNESQRPYLRIELNSTVCGDGYCTPLNETIGNCLQDCTPMNYIEVNGTTFTQPEPINITGWSGNLSSDTYLWNNYNGTLQSMLPTGTGVQTNITLSSNLNVGVYNVSCNSTWNSTLALKTFTVVSTSTTVPTTAPSGGGGGGGGSIKTTTTTSTTIITTRPTTSKTTTTTVQSSSTTTVPAKAKLNFMEIRIPLWAALVIVVILVVIIAMFYVIKRRQKFTVLDVNLDDYNYDYE